MSTMTDLVNLQRVIQGPRLSQWWFHYCIGYNLLAYAGLSSPKKTA
jgi:hypothetical protein